MTIRTHFKHSLSQKAGYIDVHRESSFDEVYNLLERIYDGVKVVKVERIKTADSDYNGQYGSTLMTSQQLPYKVSKEIQDTWLNRLLINS